MIELNNEELLRLKKHEQISRQVEKLAKDASTKRKYQSVSHSEQKLPKNHRAFWINKETDKDVYNQSEDATPSADTKHYAPAMELVQ